MVAKRVVLGTCLGIVALVMVVISMLSPNWYYVYLNGDEWWSGLDKEVYWDDYSGTTSVDDYEDSALGDVASNTKIILIIGLVMALVFIILGFISAFETGGNAMRWIPSVVGILAGALFLIGVFYFDSNFPNAQDDAFGGFPDEATHYSGSASLLALAGAIVCMVGGAITFHKATPTPMPMMQPVWGMQGMAPQQYPQQYMGQPSQQYPGQSPQQYPGQPLQQYPMQPSQQYPGQSPQQYPGQAPQQYPGQAPQQYPGQAPQQYPGQPSQQYPGQFPQQYPGQSPQQYPGQPPRQYPPQS